MRKLHVAFVVVALMSGLLLGSMLGTPAMGQGGGTPQSPGRYQISAFAGQAGGTTVFHGCYTVDTATGELWVTIPDQKPKKVGESIGR